jgi:hypothetical protein
LLGYLSDHYHMRREWGGDAIPKFLGAWQIGTRQFDPSEPELIQEDDDEDTSSHTSTTLSISPPTVSVTSAYPDPYADTALCANRSQWVLTKPADFRGLICYPQLVAGDNCEWIALNGFWNWREPRFQPHSLGVKGSLEMWVHVRSWLARERDYTKFLSGIRKTHFWGHGCNGVSLGDGWLGEYPWSAAFAEANKWCQQPDEWIRESKILHTQTACSWDRRGGFIVPSPQVCDLMDLSWFGPGPQFRGKDKRIEAFQAQGIGTSKSGPCVVRGESLRRALERANLRIVWGLLGERECWDHSRSGSPVCVGGSMVEFSGCYVLNTNGVNGGITKRVIRQIPDDQLGNGQIRPPKKVADQSADIFSPDVTAARLKEIEDFL